MKVFILEVIQLEKINVEDIKELEDSELVIAYEEIDGYIKYLNDSIINEEVDEEDS